MADMDITPDKDKKTRSVLKVRKDRKKVEDTDMSRGNVTMTPGYKRMMSAEQEPNSSPIYSPPYTKQCCNCSKYFKKDDKLFVMRMPRNRKIYCDACVGPKPA